MLRRTYGVLVITLAGCLIIAWLGSYFHFLIPKIRSKTSDFALVCGQSYLPDETLFVVVRGDGTTLFAFSEREQINLEKSFLSNFRIDSELSISFRSTTDLVDQAVTKWPHEAELSRTDLALKLGTSLLFSQSFSCERASNDQKLLSAAYSSMMDLAKTAAEIEKQRKEEEREQTLRSRKL